MGHYCRYSLSAGVGGQRATRGGAWPDRLALIIIYSLDESQMREAEPKLLSPGGIEGATAPVMDASTWMSCTLRIAVVHVFTPYGYRVQDHRDQLMRDD